MRELTMIVLLWVIAILAAHGWQHSMKSAASYEMRRWSEVMNEDVRKALSND